MAGVKAGFAETDITPPVGTHKIGWIKDIVSDRVLDPLFARAMVLESQGRTVGLVQLDTLSIRWTQVADIRSRISTKFAFPGDAIMVAATHNHAGPAVANCGAVKRDDAYVEALVAKVVFAFGQAIANKQDAEIGLGGCFEFRVPHNRRVVMRDGTVRTHGTFGSPEALFVEGPVDPEVAVLAARSKDGRMLGAVVNFTCHPTHHGGETTLSGGFPGILAQEMRSRGCPVTLFLNGASGNISETDPCRGGAGISKEEIGRILADDTSNVLSKMTYGGESALGSRSKTILLPFREISQEEIKGTKQGAQRFIDSALYDLDIPRQIERARRMGAQPAEVQVLFVNDHAYAGIPGECFVQLGLRVKEGAYPRHALVVGHANGMVGYLPHKEAFLRGGYETTFAGWSRLAPGAGEMLADCAVQLVKDGP
jgi:hypothetical protein